MKKERVDGRKKVLVALFFVLLCVLAGSGCTMENPLPYAMTAGELRFGMVEGVCSVAGVFFRLVNISGREITAVEMTCTIYDHTGRASPFIGNSTIRSRLEVRLAAGAERELCLVLDGYMSGIPQEGEVWLVDQLYASRIEYADGSSWSDPLGLAGGGM